MKVKTSVTLEESTLAAIDTLASKGSSRSRLIEQAVIELIERYHRRLREERDREILDRHADALNKQVKDVLAFQVVP